MKTCEACNTRLPADSHGCRRYCAECRQQADRLRWRNWRNRNRDSVLTKKRGHDALKRREAGMLTRAERTRAQQTLAAERLSKIRALLNQNHGLSMRAACRRLGISHNIIVGLTYRQRQMEQQGQ